MHIYKMRPKFESRHSVNFESHHFKEFIDLEIEQKCHSSSVNVHCM